MSRRKRIERTRQAREAIELRRDCPPCEPFTPGTTLKPLAFDPYVDTFRLAPVDPDRVREEPEWYHKDFNLGEAGE